MSLADLAEESLPWQTCAVCHTLETLDTAKADLLIGLLSNANVRYSHIAAAAADEGLNLEAEALSRHARGICKAKVRLR